MEWHPLFYKMHAPWWLKLKLPLGFKDHLYFLPSLVTCAFHTKIMKLQFLVDQNQEQECILSIGWLKITIQIIVLIPKLIITFWEKNSQLIDGTILKVRMWWSESSFCCFPVSIIPLLTTSWWKQFSCLHWSPQKHFWFKRSDSQEVAQTCPYFSNSFLPHSLPYGRHILGENEIDRSLLLCFIFL